MVAGRLSLGKRIALLVIAGLAVVLFLFGFLSLRSLQESSDRTFQERLGTAQLTARHMDSFIDLQMDALSQSIRAVPIDIDDSNLDPEKRLLDLVYNSGGTVGHGGFLVDRRGEMVWAEPAAERSRPLDPLIASIARTVVQRETGAVSDAYRDGMGRTLVALAVPTLDRDGRTSGALIRFLDLTDPMLNDLLHPISLGNTGYAEIVDSQGFVMASSNPSRMFSKSDHTDQFAALIAAGRPTVGGCHNCHETAGASQVTRPDILAFAPLSVAPWGIALRQSEEEALAPRRELERSLMFVSVLTLLAAVSMVRLGSRVVVLPVRELTQAARRIAAGDLDSQVKSTGPAEVGQLARAFDDMRARLKSSLEKLEQANSTLELRVDQRTRELSALLDVSKMMTSSLDVRQLMDTLVARTGEVLELANAGFVALYQERSGVLEVKASWGYAEGILGFAPVPGEGITGRAFKEGKPVMLDGARAVRASTASLSVENRAWIAQARQGQPPGTSLLALPLVVNGRVIGVMALEHYKGARTFSQSDLRLAQALADQIAVAVENARLYQEVLEKERLRGELLDKVISAQEEERRRIARELHDDTCQSLAVLALSLEEVHENLPDSATLARSSLVRLKTQLRAVLKEVRAMALNLRPSMLDDLGLILAIDWYAKEQIAPRGVEVNLEMDEAPRGMSPAVETVLFRITQEALNNVVKHSGADSVTVRLLSSGIGVVLEVEDNGLGFDVDRILGPRRPRHRLGLHGMMERASLSGGALQVRSAPDQGTLIRVELPIQGTRNNRHENNQSITVGRP